MLVFWIGGTLGGGGPGIRMANAEALGKFRFWVKEPWLYVAAQTCAILKEKQVGLGD